MRAEIERMRAEREQQEATTHTESVPDIKRTDDRFWCSCEKCELMGKYRNKINRNKI